MKILHITNNLGSGGAEKLLQQIIPIQQKNNNEIELLLLTNKGNVFNINNIKIYSINKGIYSWKNIFIIRRYLKKDYDIVHCHLFPTQYWVIFASLFLKKKTKLIFTEHSTNNKRRNNILFKNIERFIYRKYNKVISITKKVENNLTNWVGKNNITSTVIENGIDINKFYNAKKYNKTDIEKKIKEKKYITNDDR